MKKICFVDFDMTVTGGVEQVTASLANALCEQYHVFLYAINSNHGDVKYNLDERVKYSHELCGETRLRYMIQKVWKPFRRFVRENGIEIVILMGNYPALIMAFAKIGIKAKYIYCDHGGLMNQWHQKDITLIRLIDTIMADRIVVLTEKTRQDYINKFKVKDKKIECIYNWVNPEVEAKRQPYDAEAKKILSVGRICKEKGYDLLLDVAKEVLSKHPDWTWEVLGEGEAEVKTMMLRKIAQYELETKVVLKGNIPRAYEHYHEYAFLAMTSYREGLPIVLLEAKALGLPMVSFDIETGPNEIIEQDVNGYLIKPFDCKQMVDVLEGLIQNKELREKLSMAVGGDARKFSYEKILESWIKCLERVGNDCK